MQKILDAYKPAWFNFNPNFAIIYGQTVKSMYASDTGVHAHDETVALENKDEGRFILHLVHKKNEHAFPSPDGHERCIVLMHGVTGNSCDAYIQELAGACIRAGYHVIIPCHYAPRNEKDLRLMNFCK